MEDPVKILIIDDNPGFAATVKRLLAVEHCRFSEAYSGREGIATAVTFMPDLVLLNEAIPGMDGYVVCRRIKADPVTEGTFVVMLVMPKNSGEAPEAGREGGADGFITLTESDQELAARIHFYIRLIRRGKTLRENQEQFADIFETLSVGISYTSLTGNVIAINKALENMLEIPQDEIVGRNILALARNLLSGKNLKSVIPPLTSILKGKKTAPFIIEYKDKTLEISSNINWTTRRLTGVVRDITSATQAEKRYQILSARNEAILASVPDIIMEVDTKKVYTFANQAGIDFFGEDVLGREASYYFEGEQKTYKIVDTLFKGDEHIIYVESWQRRRDGEKRLLAWWCRVMKDKNRHIIGILSTARDITANHLAEVERVKAEQNLIESEEKYRNLFETMSQGVVYQDAGGVILSANHAAQEMLGLSLDQLQGRTSTDPRWRSIHEDGSDFPGETHPSPVAMRSGKKVDNVVMGVFNPQKERYTWLLISAIPQFRPGEKKPYQSFTTFTDITERKRTEDLLLLSERYLREIINEAPFGAHSYLLNPDGHLIFSGYNPAADQLLKIEHQPLVGKPISEAFPGLAGTPIPEKYRQVAVHGERFSDEQVTYFEGQIQGAFEIHAFQTGENRMTVFFRDITERLMAQLALQELNNTLEKKVAERTAALQASNGELEAFTYSVSHDLRAPLRAMDGFARILLEDYTPRLDPEGIRLLNVISDNANDMGRLIDDLLAFSRISREEITRTRIDMNKLVQNVWEELSTPGEEHVIDFRVHPLADAFGSINLVRQVWRNLIANAIKFTSRKKDRMIVIGSRSEGNEIVYSIRDNGVGFNMAYSKKLFGVFQRLHNKHDYEGTGVGLAIVQRIIQRHGGIIWAEAVIDEGATFSFTLEVREGCDNH